MGSHPRSRQFAIDTGTDLIAHVSKRPQALFVATGYRTSGLRALIKAMAAGTSRRAWAPESPAICSGGYE
jgi:hypothetical protein